MNTQAHDDSVGERVKSEARIALVLFLVVIPTLVLVGLMINAAMH